MIGNIKKLLENKGVYDWFYFGSGARSGKGIVKIHIYDHSKAINKKYAIQYEKTTETIAIWNIEKRVSLNASLNLKAGNNTILWEEISGIICVKTGIGKKNSQDESVCYMMHYALLEDFLECSQNMSIDLLSEYEGSDDNTSIIIDDCEGIEGKK